MGSESNQSLANYGWDMETSDDGDFKCGLHQEVHGVWPLVPGARAVGEPEVGHPDLVGAPGLESAGGRTAAGHTGALQAPSSNPRGQDLRNKTPGRSLLSWRLWL